MTTGAPAHYHSAQLAYGGCQLTLQGLAYLIFGDDLIFKSSPSLILYFLYNTVF